MLHFPARAGARRALAFAILLALALPALAIELVRSTLDGGGGTSSSGSLALTGTIGQWDAGASSAGDLSLQGGFWFGGNSATAAPEDGSPRFSRLQVPVPNPFNPKTSISFDLAKDERATLRVFDVSGRLHRVLVDEVLPAGPHTVSWDGRDDGGHELASGVYFIQMRAGNFAAVRKAVMVR